MADDASGPSHDGAGVRRRHSAHDTPDASASVTSDGIQAGTSIIQGNQQRAASSDGGRRTGRQTGSTGNDMPPSSVSQAAETPRVRFSADVERRPTWGKLKAKHSDDSIPTLSSFAQRQGQRPAGLAIDKYSSHASSSMRRQSPGSSPVMSPPSAPKSRGTSPASPHGRHRGLSLRSSIFQRGMTDSSQERHAAIEMQDVDPEAMAGSSTQSRQYSSKKSMESRVEVVPVESAYDDLPRFSLDKKAHREDGFLSVTALPHYQTWLQRRAARNPAWRELKAGYHKLRKTVLRVSEIPPSKDGRHIVLDSTRRTPLIDERTGKPHIPNTVRSSRYTAWNFLPRQLFAQFSKLANFYFLVVSILQMIPGLSTTGTYTTIIPLLIFISVSMAKEGYDDLRRYRLDKVENSQIVTVLDTTQPSDSLDEIERRASQAEDPLRWSIRKWHDLKVGDVVKLDRDQPVPADMVLLNSKGEHGVANVETMALDGETNLKPKQVPQPLVELCRTPTALSTWKAHFVVEDPNLDLYNFEGKVTIGDQTVPVTNNEVLYLSLIHI